MSVNINVRVLVGEIVGLFVVFALALFLPAGTFRWSVGWLFLILFFGFIIVMSIWLLKHDPALLQERMTGLRRPDQSAWDRAIMSLIFIFFIVWLVLMPLDAVRFQWSHVPVWIQVAGTIILISSFYLFYLVIREKIPTCHQQYASRKRGDKPWYLRGLTTIYVTLLFCLHHILSGNHSIVRILVWISSSVDTHGFDSNTSFIGRTDVTEGSPRL